MTESANRANHFDAAIIGSGFAGSILASILSRQGMRVALIDPAMHPRFAIGESSTPIADGLLRRLGAQYDLEPLVALSTWGSWQQHFPAIGCGLKRGFTYFAHRSGEAFRETTVGERSLWVAASKSDDVADTHWYRPDVDSFLFRLAIESGAHDFAGYAVQSIDSSVSPSGTMLHCVGPKTLDLRSDWVIDASGQAAALARLRGLQDKSAELSTESYSTFAHFRDVGSMSAWLASRGMESRQPFDGDDAAQHHLLPDGWMWMLRMNNGITSVGITSPTPPTLDWSAFPTLRDLLDGATLVTPPGRVTSGRRLQRWFDPVVGPRELMLPTAALTLDPLHSTGIAHALAGVERVIPIIMEKNAAVRAQQLDAYRESLRQEAWLLDRLVATAYATMNDFPRFTVSAMLFFAAAIRCEERLQQGEHPSAFWNADDRVFVERIRWATRQLTQPSGKGFDESAISEAIQPWNTAGLMDHSVHNRYAYTAASK